MSLLRKNIGRSLRRRIESRFAQRALGASIQRIRTEKNPYRVDGAFLLNGLKLFKEGCAGGYGSYGKQSDWGAEYFYPPAPQFAEAPPRRSEGEISYIVQHGIRYSGMAGRSGLISKEQTWQVASFLSRLDSLPPTVAGAWHKRWLTHHGRFLFLWPACLPQEPEAKYDPFAPVRLFVGTWSGDPGYGAARRTCICNQHISMIGCDRARKKFVLRQFHIKAFVNTYVQQTGDSKKLAFVS